MHVFFSLCMYVSVTQAGFPLELIEIPMLRDWKVNMTRVVLEKFLMT